MEWSPDGIGAWSKLRREKITFEAKARDLWAEGEWLAEYPVQTTVAAGKTRRRR